MASQESSGLWLFGYGSLLWKHDFAFDIMVPAFIEGYDRFFYQGSTDHRGTPGSPGRVVTLLQAKDPKTRVWGVAFHIPPQHVAEVISYLDIRERGGYVQTFIPCYTRGQSSNETEVHDASTVAIVTPRALCYIATEANEEYLGAATVDAIAQQIHAAKGPSGANTEYALMLAQSLRAIGAQDKHVFDIETAIKKLQDK